MNLWAPGAGRRNQIGTAAGNAAGGTGVGMPLYYKLLCARNLYVMLLLSQAIYVNCLMSS